MLWRLAVGLSLLLLEAQAAPFPSNLPLPSIPTNKRTQYYFLQNDGSYQQGYDTGNGQYHTSFATSENQVDGAFGYTNEDGNRVVYQYSAGAPGYVPSTSTPNNDQFVPHSNPDTSYSFSYASADQGRSESRDSEGNVEGQYSYISDGQRYRLEYEAGQRKGFVVHNNINPNDQSLDEPPPQYPINNLDDPYLNNDPYLITRSYNPDGFYSFSYVTDDHSRDEKRDSRGFETSFSFVPDGREYENQYNNRKLPSSDDYIHRAEKNYQFPQAPESVSYAPYENDFSENPASYSDSPQDSSFSFSYNADDHEHSQSSDSEGNIQGSFSFTADDGYTRQVDYEAGPGKGFVAKGRHLPQRPSLPSLTVRAPPIQYSKPNPISQPTSQPNLVPPYANQKQPTENQDYDYEYYDENSDQSYGFEFHAGDSARKETSDKKGRVTGYYTFLDDQQNQKTVHYQSGPDTGFQAYGEHIPMKDPIPIQRSSIPSLYPVNRNPVSSQIKEYNLPRKMGYMVVVDHEDSDYEPQIEADYTKKERALPVRHRTQVTFETGKQPLFPTYDEKPSEIEIQQSNKYDSEQPLIGKRTIQLPGGVLQQWSNSDSPGYGYIYQMQ